jgi:8-oxo-dGTP pyrophosphatase MutT (NUDIX family)
MQSSAMRVDAMDEVKSRLITRWSPSRRHPPSAKFLRLSQLRKLRGCDQVAAVCYRVRPSGIEFLLVRTNSGHWTFPKGKAEPGLTHAQAAALEAFEEAGVHGRIEETSFARYVRRKRADARDFTRSAPKPAEQELAVQAHLCEVSRLGPPQESNRHPTWFSVEKTKRRLQEDRSSDFAAELARVVDRAVTRIKRLRSKAAPAK